MYAPPVERFMTAHTQMCLQSTAGYMTQAQRDKLRKGRQYFVKLDMMQDRIGALEYRARERDADHDPVVCGKGVQPHRAAFRQDERGPRRPHVEDEALGLIGVEGKDEVPDVLRRQPRRAGVAREHARDLAPIDVDDAQRRPGALWLVEERCVDGGADDARRARQRHDVAEEQRRLAAEGARAVAPERRREREAGPARSAVAVHRRPRL